MPEALAQQKLYPYDGSFDATKHPLFISAKDVVEAQNVVYSTYSSKKKKPGTTVAPNIQIPGNRRILSGIDFWRLGIQWEIVYNGVQIFAINPADGTWNDIGAGFAVPVDVPVHFEVFQGLLMVFFEDGVTKPKGWIGSGLLVDLFTGTNPASPFGKVWLNKLWVPDPAVPGRLLHTNTGTLSLTGGDSGSIDLDVNDGLADLTSIFPPFYGSLYVTKRFKTYRITPVTLSDGSLVFSPICIDEGQGCIAHGSVSASPQNIFFSSDEGFHYFANTSKLSSIESEEFSLEIVTLWRGEMNFKRAKYMRAIYDKNLKSYICLFPSDSRLYPNDAWGFSIKAKKWYRWPEYNMTSIWRYIDVMTKRVETLVGSSRGQIGVVDDNTTKDFDKPINILIQSGLICPSGSPDDSFAFHFVTPVYVPQLSGEFNLTYKIDGKTIETKNFKMTDPGEGDALGEDFIPGQSVLAGLPRVKVDRRSAKGHGMILEFFVEHIGIGDNLDGFELLGILIDVDREKKVTGRTVA